MSSHRPTPFLRVFTSLFALLIFLSHDELLKLADMLNGYGSKVACSLHFLQGRDLGHISTRELAWPPISPFVRLQVINSSCIESRIWFAPFLHPRVACLHEHGRLGCAIVARNKTSTYLDTHIVDSRVGNGNDFSDFAVMAPSNKVDFLTSKLRHVIDSHFEDAWVNSRAFLVVNASKYPAEILLERYGDGFNSSTPQAGWSMTKSVMAMVIGALLNSDTNVFPSGMLTKVPLSNDVHSASLEDMMRLQDGMDFDERYSIGTDPVRMLFDHDATGIPSKSRTTPGKCFHYSSKSGNVVSRFIRSKFSTEGAYLNAPYRYLFRPLNIQSARLETDPSKVFVASSFCLMTPLDWIRLGVLLANEGTWPSTGKEIMKANFVRSLRAPTRTSRGTYGLGFWLGGNNATQFKTDDDEMCDQKFPTRVNPARKWYANLPKDSFFMSGFEGQYLLIMPNEKLVMLRMGASREKMPLWKQFQPDELFLPVIEQLTALSKL